MRISTKSLKDYPLLSRVIFYFQKRKNGSITNPAKVWGRSPWLFLGFNFFYAALIRKSSPLEHTLFPLVNVLVAQINHCPFCIDFNASLLHKKGIKPEKINALANYETSEFFSEQERTALAYAESITRTDKKVDDELFAKLRHNFTEDQIIELTAMIAFENLSSKFNAALAIPTEKFD